LQRNPAPRESVIAPTPQRYVRADKQRAKSGAGFPTTMSRQDNVLTR
jgi:hypothetical protein